MKDKVLIVDDEADIREILRFNLENAGYEVDCAESAEEALSVFSPSHSLILLDVMMEGMSGFKMAEVLRKEKKTQVPIIFLTARSGENDLLTGFSAGGDDYIGKPFSIHEVLARVKSQLRRYTTLGGKTQDPPSQLTIGGITLDDETKVVTVDGEPVSLTPTEFAILRFLMAHPGKVFSSKALYQAVWNEVPLGSEGAVAVHIRHLREKIEINPSDPRYLKVVWGQGYKMEGEHSR